MAPAKNTFTVTHADGRTETKSTAKEYTHAVVGSNNVRASVRCWCGSRALAEKQMSTWAHWLDVHIVEVERA